MTFEVMKRSFEDYCSQTSLHGWVYIPLLGDIFIQNEYFIFYLCYVIDYNLYNLYYLSKQQLFFLVKRLKTN